LQREWQTNPQDYKRLIEYAYNSSPLHGPYPENSHRSVEKHRKK